MTFKQFVLLGPPGVDVTGQAEALARRWHLSLVTMETLLAEAPACDSARDPSIGMGASPEIALGLPNPDGIVPDGIVMKLLRKRLERPDAMLEGWVLSGAPQTLAQAQELEVWLETVGQPAPTVVYLKAMTGLLINRLWAERGAAESVAQIRSRLSAYDVAIAPILEYYQQRSQLTTVNGSLPFAEVAHELALLGCEVTGAARLIQDEAELDSLLAQTSVLVVDCMASWCGACKQVTPLIDQLADAYGDRVNVTKIDFDTNRQITERFGLKGMPAVMFFKDGELQETLMGVKSYQDYSTTVTRFLE